MGQAEKLARIMVIAALAILLVMASIVVWRAGHAMTRLLEDVPGIIHSEMEATRGMVDETTRRELDQTRALVEETRQDLFAEVAATRGDLMDVAMVADARLASIQTQVAPVLNDVEPILEHTDNVVRTLDSASAEFVRSNRWFYDCSKLYDAQGNPLDEHQPGASVCASKQAWSRFLGLSGTANKTMGQIYLMSKSINEATPGFLASAQQIAANVDLTTHNFTDFTQQATVTAANIEKNTRPLPAPLRVGIQLGTFGLLGYGTIAGALAQEGIERAVTSIAGAGKKD